MKYYSGIIKVVALIILMPIVLGKCTFSKTVQLYNDYRNIQALEEQLAHTTSSHSIIRPAPLHNENLISNGRLVELINQACAENNVSVKQYEPQLLDKEGDYKLYTANLILSGNYIDLLKTLKYWEDNILSIKISSLKFEYDEKKMKGKEVEMTMITKQVESN
ncbi:MAG: hypothetical protein LBT43_03265 [Prevotella sp.]|jgi:hypothetical protein|nr:hypothetical protein [Prevotella sp.]